MAGHNSGVKRRPPPSMACEACRRVKMRCVRSSKGDSQALMDCDRCERTGRHCVTPKASAPGRKPGALGRFRGLQKALRHLHSELQKADTVDGSTDEKASLLDLVRGLQPASKPRPPQTSVPLSTQVDEAPLELVEALPPLVVEEEDSVLSNANAIAGDTLASEDEKHISDPLAFLAAAAADAESLGPKPSSNLQSPFPVSEAEPNLFTHHHNPQTDTLARTLLQRPGRVTLGLNLSQDSLQEGLKELFSHARGSQQGSNYFARNNSSQGRDTGPDLDPVDLCLVSMEEVTYLFQLYFQRLHPFNGILDPLLHTPEFVRSRSSLLFTWILALAAQFDSGSGILSQRLRFHGERLSEHVHARGYKSVEIVQGYYISLISAQPARTRSEERSWMYTAFAFGMAAELSLHREGDLQSDSEGLGDERHIQRRARNRQRTWLRILLWERANSAFYGRMNPILDTDLSFSVESWWTHPIADPQDRYSCAYILLRSRLVMAHEKLTRELEPPRGHQGIVKTVDSTLEPWRRVWLPTPADQAPATDNVSDIFLRLVFIHGRLWTLSFALRGLRRTDLSAGAVLEDCFHAAVNCCEVSISCLQQVGEPIYCMHTPVWAMISYAAVLALKLFPLIHGTRPGYEVELVALVAQLALQLERAGTTPVHRLGAAAIFARQIFLVLQPRAALLRQLMDETGSNVGLIGDTRIAETGDGPPVLLGQNGTDSGSLFGALGSTNALPRGMFGDDFLLSDEAFEQYASELLI